MTIDSLLAGGWDASMIEALDHWRQGHLVRADRVAWVTTRSTTPATDATLAGAVGIVSNTGYLAVVSQTCDVVLTGPGAKHPFVQVCPVHDLSSFDPGKVTQIQRGEIRDWVYLTAPPTSDAHWAIDVRVLGAMHKAVLAEQEPISGFASEEDERQIGVRLRTKFEREALPDLLSKDLPDALRNCLKAALKKSSWADDVEQLRLLVLEGSSLAPTRVQLMVLTEVKFDPAQKEPLRIVWESFRKRMKKAGIASTSIRFKTLEETSIRDYRASIPIHTPELGNGFF